MAWEAILRRSPVRHAPSRMVRPKSASLLPQTEALQLTKRAEFCGLLFASMTAAQAHL
jgi:hypothetical protein